MSDQSRNVVFFPLSVMDVQGLPAFAVRWASKCCGITETARTELAGKAIGITFDPSLDEGVILGDEPFREEARRSVDGCGTI